jgi:transcriptional regulator with XRE-family HTH domain
VYTEQIADSLGGVVKSARIEKQLTQRQLAERLSITAHYLMTIENNQRIPSSDLLFRIIRELEISADAIFYPEHEHDHALLKKLQILLKKCDKKDIATILEILQSIITRKG